MLLYWCYEVATEEDYIYSTVLLETFMGISLFLYTVDYFSILQISSQQDGVDVDDYHVSITLAQGKYLPS